MSPPGLVRASWLFARKDLRVEWQTWETLSSSIVFSLIVLVVFNFAFGADAVADVGVHRLVPGVVWTLLAFAAVVAMARGAELERRRDTLAALLLAPVDRTALFIGKFLANLTLLTTLELIVVPLSALLYNYDLLAIAIPMLAVLLLHTAGIAVLGTLFAAMASRIGRGEAMLATLLFPAAAPLFISAVHCTTALLEHGELGGVSRWLLLTAGFDGLYLMVAILTFEFVVED